MEKPNDISQTLKSKQTHVTPLGEGKVLKKTPTYVSLKLKIFWGDVHTYAGILTHPRITL